MKTFIKNMGYENVTLSGYILDSSREMKNANKRPAILVFPGGGYMMCSDREAEPVALAYTAAGYNAFILRYTVGTKTAVPNALRDAENALEYIIQNAEEFCVDTEKIAAIGFSAGGHLAASLGTLGRVKPAALMLGYACILPEMGKLLDMEMPDLCAAVDKTTPPAFIFSTCKDGLVPIENSLAFANALCREKVDFEVHIFQEGTHGLSLSTTHTSGGSATMTDPNFADWLRLSLNWLKVRWGDFPEITPAPVKTNINMTIGELLENEKCRKILAEVSPLLEKSITTNKGHQSLPFTALVANAPDLFNKELIAALEEALEI